MKKKNALNQNAMSEKLMRKEAPTASIKERGIDTCMSGKTPAAGFTPGVKVYEPTVASSRRLTSINPS